MKQRLISYCVFAKKFSLQNNKVLNSKENPLISVIIPSYNHARFLGRALASLLEQTYINWEAIVIDNYSSDNTDEILAGFDDSRITALKIRNKGVIAASRNAGVKASRGEWVAFLDSDDWWTKDKLEVCLEYFHKGVDFIYHDLEIVHNTPRIRIRKFINSWQVKNPVFLDLLLKGNPISNSSVVVRRRLIEEIGGINEDEKIISCEDYHAWLRISQITDRFIYLPRKLGYYLIHNQGISKKDNSHAYFVVVNEFANVLDNYHHRIVESNIEFISGRNLFYKKEYKISFNKILKSLIMGGKEHFIRRFIFLILVIFKLTATRLFFVKNIL